MVFLAAPFPDPPLAATPVRATSSVRAPRAIRIRTRDHRAVNDRILIVGASWVGDMVMAQPLLARLRAAAPQSPIDVVAPAWVLPIVRRMPEVADLVAMKLRMHDRNRRFWHARSYAPTLYRGARDAWHV